GKGGRAYPRCAVRRSYRGDLERGPAASSSLFWTPRSRAPPAIDRPPLPIRVILLRAHDLEDRRALSRRRRARKSLKRRSRYVAAALENDLALMKGGEFRAMTDADDGRVCELPRQKSHQTILAA